MTVSMQPSSKAYLYAMLAILFWSTMSSAFKLSLRLMPFDLLLFWSVLAAVLLLLSILLFTKKLGQMWYQSKRAWLSSALMGFINPFAYYVVLFKAYELLRAQEAGVLNYSWPIVLVVLSALFLSQKITGRDWVAIGISFLALIIISTEGKPWTMQFTHPTGVLLAVSSAFLWASYWILNVRDTREAIQKIASNMLFGLLYISVFLNLSGSWQLPKPQALTASLYIGFFEMGIGFVLWLTALGHAENTAKISNLVFLSPFMALFWIYLLVGEKILPSTVIGLACIIGSIFIQQRRPKQFKNKMLKRI